MFDERIFTAAGKLAKEDGRHDLSSMCSSLEDSFLDGPSSAACQPGPSGDCLPLKRIKTEPSEEDIIQVTVADASTGGSGGGGSSEEPGEDPAAEPPADPPVVVVVASPPAAAATTTAAVCPATTSPSAPPFHTPHPHPLFHHQHPESRA
ncbi:hypothetical protein CRUP_013879, partial [Coryphaenoides rupestris]